MPHGWTAPTVFFRYRGFVIYFTYDDDNSDSSWNEYWFAVSSSAAEGDWFDVRDLEEPEITEKDLAREDLPRSPSGVLTKEAIDQLTIERAIATGELWNYVDEDEADRSVLRDVEYYRCWPDGRWNTAMMRVWSDLDGEALQAEIQRQVAEQPGDKPQFVGIYHIVPIEEQ